jgi:serine/threonine protein kinase
MPVSMVQHIAARVVGLLRALHTARVVHGDLKLPNILLSTSGTVHLVDFGSSVVLSSESCRVKDFLQSTLHHRAPELFHEDDDAVVYAPYAVDMFALGVCTYELLVGAPPFGFSVRSIDAIGPAPLERREGEPVTLPRRRDGFDNVRSVVSFPADVPAIARDFVCGLMERDPSGRSTTDELLRHPFIAQVHLEAESDPDASWMSEEYIDEVDMQTLGL